MKKTLAQKVLEHPDHQELISKSIIGIPPRDIHEWLVVKYSSVNDKKFIISEKNIKDFQDNYLDIYNLIQSDIAQTKTAIAKGTEDQLTLAVQDNPSYKQMMLNSATQELDIRKMLATSAIAIETRLGQIYDEINVDPRNINSRIDRVFIEYLNTFGALLEKYHKIIEAPTTTTVQHNINFQVSEQIMVFYDIIKEIISEIDTEASLSFIDKFQKRIAQANLPLPTDMPSSETRFAEAKLLNETITKKINES